MGANPMPVPPRRKSNYKPILLTLIFSFLLAVGSCFGFLGTINSLADTKLNGIFADGFVICMLVFLGALLAKAVHGASKGGGVR